VNGKWENRIIRFVFTLFFLGQTENFKPENFRTKTNGYDEKGDEQIRLHGFVLSYTCRPLVLFTQRQKKKRFVKSFGFV
jgi:hypothetical protein